LKAELQQLKAELQQLKAELQQTTAVAFLAVQLVSAAVFAAAVVGQEGRAKEKGLEAVAVGQEAKAQALATQESVTGSMEEKLMAQQMDLAKAIHENMAQKAGTVMCEKS
jgi:hypothetical protein